MAARTEGSDIAGPDNVESGAARIYRSSVKTVAEEMDVDLDDGLDREVAQQRRERHGPNRLRHAQQRRWWQILFDQFKSLVVGLLLLAGVVSAAVGEFIEAVAILAAVVADVAIGFGTELRARKSVEALHQFEKAEAVVIRDGEEREIRSEDLVRGDIVLLRSGEVVPADLRLVEVSDLEIDESALTGESMPVGKRTEALESEEPVGDRANMAFKGTAVTRGSGSGIVVATGMDTEIGHISEMVEEAEEEAPPLEERLDLLAKRLIWVTLGMAALVAGAGLIAGRDMILIIETAIVLGVAAVPEGLPIVASLALARGVRQMAEHKALVKKLSAVETLGSAGIVFTDKTGTLTEGRMEVARIVTEGRDLELRGDDGETSQAVEDERAEALLEAAVRCTEADLDEEAGDPMDLAILELGRQLDRNREDLMKATPLVRGVPFDTETNMMATIHEDESGQGLLVAVKGATESVLQVATRVMNRDGEAPLEEEGRESWLERNDQLAGDGLRVVAVAVRTLEVEEVDDPYESLTLLGLLGLWDPPRDGVEDSVSECRGAGIRVLMVTGDHPATAQSIARRVGISEGEANMRSSDEVEDPDEESEDERERLREIDVFARVSPENKLDLITLHQQAGSVVAMTGDGINDAPALEKADIGVAMGERGTQVAREAADIVLLDDAFDTIVTAIRYGRTVFANIRKFVVFLLSGNLAEILAVAVATLFGLPLPLLPLQILYINFVADVFPALALGFGAPDRDVMSDPPRDPSEPILARKQWLEIAGWGVLIGGTVLGVLLVGIDYLEFSSEEVVSVTFLTFALARVWHVFNMSRAGSGLLINEVTTNPYVWGGVGVGIGLILLAAFFEPLAGLLGVSSLGGAMWLTILVASLVPLIVGQIVRAWRAQRNAA